MTREVEELSSQTGRLANAVEKMGVARSQAGADALFLHDFSWQSPGGRTRRKIESVALLPQASYDPVEQ